MPTAIVLCILIVVAFFILTYASNGRHTSRACFPFQRGSSHGNLLAPNAYEKNRVLTEREKLCFRQLSGIVQPYGWVVLCKVPACCLMLPRVKCPEYSTALATLSTIYLDYVLCDTYMKASLVITLETSERDMKCGVTADLKLDTALEYCGVPVLHTIDVDAAARSWIEGRINLDASNAQVYQ